MDQLPDLQSDADVDALMARVRAKLAPPAAAPAVTTSERSGNALRDWLAVQEEYASAMIHALEVIGAALEDLDDEREKTTGRRAGRIEPAARRIKGRSRKPR